MAAPALTPVRLILDHADKYPDKLRVKEDAGFFPEPLQRMAAADGLILVTAYVSVVTACDRYDPGKKRDFALPERSRITRPVPTLVMAVDRLGEIERIIKKV